MARSETFQMSINWLPEHRPLSENENYDSCPRSRLETDHEAAAMGLPNSPLPGQAWPQSKYVAGPVSRGCCWCN
jgi:hypothetical protein